MRSFEKTSVIASHFESVCGSECLLDSPIESVWQSWFARLSVSATRTEFQFG